ncbi:MAG: hypothetical protein JNL32_00670 [Candidatus Kapabacteria bacterium]|nr:hypothetical protein [Candidatus Kapabacteria bacterium]
MNNIYTHSEMQELLPDYCSGMLTGEENARFEQSLASYPDLHISVKELQHVFAVMDKESFVADIDRRTRNLSVRVNERMRSNKQAWYQSLWARVATPAVGAALCLYLVSLSGLFRTGTTTDLASDMFSSADEQHIESIVTAMADSQEMTMSIPSTGDVSAEHTVFSVTNMQSFESDLAREIAMNFGDDLPDSHDTDIHFDDVLDSATANDVREIESIIQELEHGA